MAVCAERSHKWRWRRKRQNSYGRWECIVCGAKSNNVPLNIGGHPLRGPE